MLDLDAHIEGRQVRLHAIWIKEKVAQRGRAVQLNHCFIATNCDTR